MIYNTFKDLQLSKLGFGCMRFKKETGSDNIDQQKVNTLISTAIQSGVNYFDTAYPYLDGKSEIALAEALRPFPRDSYFIADKFPGHSLPGPIDNIALFNESLKKCKTDYFDFYLLHNVNELSVRCYESPEYRIIPDILTLKAQGKIKHLGFSFHGGTELLERFLNDHDEIFEFVQIQCNYLDWTLQNAKEKYEIITNHGLGVWIMEPCRGGKLAKLNPEQTAKLKRFNPEASNASFAFRFLQDLPNVKMILSGMNEPFQLEDNLKTFAEHVQLSTEENALLMEIAEQLKNGVPCTACKYCTNGCPMCLDIPYLLECYNNYQVSKAITTTARLDALPKDKLPSACIQCKACTKACPQSINIPDVLSLLSNIYEQSPKWEEFAQPRRAQIKNDLKC